MVALKSNRMKKFVVVALLAAFLPVSQQLSAQTAAENTVNLRIDGSKTFQTIDGFGVNANTRSWDEKELQPALDLLIDSMNAQIWRVIVETVEKWEDENDNSDPFTFNWDYYNKLYETPKFQKAWDMIAYLNRRGITDNLMINFMGAVPLWMGGEVIRPPYEDEYIEMLVSFFYYAKNVRHLQIGLMSPMNEPDIRKEGPTVNAAQYRRLLNKLIRRMDALNLRDVAYVAPDVAGMKNGLKEYIPEMMKDPVIMSRIKHIGLHSYGGYYAPVDSTLKKSPFPNSTYWVTEWNEWCKGCDDGILGEYNYSFASKSVGHLLEFLKHNASAGIAWEAFDSYYEHHAPSPFSYWGMLAYERDTKTYHPRKNFYAIQQVSRFVQPGSKRILISGDRDSLTTVAFFDSLSQAITVVGVNQTNTALTLNISMKGLPAVGTFQKFYTNTIRNVYRDEDIRISGNVINTTIPAGCIFTLTGTGRRQNSVATAKIRPEPADWFAGDIHVHRNCGGKKVLPEDSLQEMMEENDLAVISLLADMGNGEVLDSKTDLSKVTGKDAPQSKPGRIIHWDAEWHWDATYSNFSHQALGGHLVLLGLKEAHQIWDESAYKILDWAGKQEAIGGFCHFEYLNDAVQNSLNCCIPVEYPVEAALGTMEYVSEDVFGVQSPNNGNYNSEAAIHAYYRLLNCGFRLGFAAGTDYPCNNNEPFGTLLTYVNVPDGSLTYDKWIRGIKEGKTVVSRNGHNEFIDMKVNGKYKPGDEIRMKKGGIVSVEIKWTAIKELKGAIELVYNGKVVATQNGTAGPGAAVTLRATQSFPSSGWICARRMDGNGHQTHSAPVYITVDRKPVRASADDAQYFITWIDNMIQKTSPRGEWNKYFTHDLDVVQGRYRKAKDIYVRILEESQPKTK
jgi:O-glycosyl hydrolase